MVSDTLPKTNIAPEDRPLKKRKFLLEATIFGGYVSFRECIFFIFTPKIGEGEPI